MSRSTQSLVFAALLLLLPGLAEAKEFIAKPAVVTSDINASKEDVFQALQETLSTWRMRKVSLEEGLVKTDWIERTKGDEIFRGRIVAEFQEDGYIVHLKVSHEKQRKMVEFQPSVGGPSPQWKDWDGDYALARDVVSSVEKALGQAPDAPDDPTKNRVRTPAIAVEEFQCFVPRDVAQRIVDLKTRRRDIVKEIKAVDGQVLDAAYGGRLDSMGDEVTRLKSRKASLEQQVTEIDREILTLVLAD